MIRIKGAGGGLTSIPNFGIIFLTYGWTNFANAAPTSSAGVKIIFDFSLVFYYCSPVTTDVWRVAPSCMNHAKFVSIP